MSVCDQPFDAAELRLAADAPLANGTTDGGELTPNDSGPAVVSSERVRTHLPRRLRGSLLASILFHAAALAVAAHPAFRALRERELNFARGPNSVALAASVASPKSEAAATVEIVKPQAAPVVEPPARRESEVPDKAAAQFASAETDQRVPLPAEEPRRSDTDEPTPQQQPEPVRPKRTAAVQLQQRDVTISIESPASSPSMAASGVTRDETPRIVQQAKIVYPPAAFAARLQGTVKLNVRINHRGDVILAAVKQSSGHDLLDRAALDAIYRYQFEPFDDSEGNTEDFVVPIRFTLPGN